MLEIAFLEFLFWLVIVFISILGFSQIVLPVALGTPIFPSFRRTRSHLEANLSAAKFEKENEKLRAELAALKSEEKNGNEAEQQPVR